MKRSLFYLLIILLVVVSIHMKPGNIQVEKKEWNHLLDKELSQWDIFMGVPHYSVELEGYEKGDGMNGTPIGLNKDPLNVFSVQMQNGEPVLKITGEIYAGLTSKKDYGDYHLSLQFKWGEKKYEPRLEDKRDSGILYHGQEPHGQFWNVWMRAPEMQVQESDCGDFHPLAGVSMDISASQVEDKENEWIYDPDGKLITFKSGSSAARCRRNANYEKPHGQWNHLELICIGDKAWHIVNGKVVMALQNSLEYNEQGQSTPLTRGNIQIQSEAAEVYYKDIKIRNITELPKEFAKQID